MLADVDADIYVMADGDATYDAASARTMIDLLMAENLDMVVGARKSEIEEALSPRASFRQRHADRHPHPIVRS